MLRKLLLIYLFKVLVNEANNFDLAGFSPVVYCKSSDGITDKCRNDVILFVNHLSTEKSVIPYDYHHFDFCMGDETYSPVANLGQTVLGERIRSGPYQIKFLEEVNCAKVCTKTYTGGDFESEKKLSTLKKGIQLNYQHHWIVDSMPVKWCYAFEFDREFCTDGFAMGCLVGSDQSNTEDDCFILYNQLNSYYPFNHVDLTITYDDAVNVSHANTSEEFNAGHIISIKVVPKSINHRDGENLNCNSSEPLAIPARNLSLGEIVNITYTYSVHFRLNRTVQLPHRWTHHFESMSFSTNILWFSLLNSFIICLFLSGIIAFIMYKTLRIEMTQKELCGWQLVRDDVFRPPCGGLLLSGLIGTSVQLICTGLVTLALANLELWWPEYSGGLMTCTLVTLFMFSMPAGYVSARMYKSFGGTNWMKNALITSTLCPGIVFSLFVAMNIVLWYNESSSAVTLSTIATLLALWLFGLVPLSFFGAFFGTSKQSIVYPVQATEIPREIPQRSILTRPITGMVIGGLLQFACIFIQLFFILNSIWADQLYNMFGSLFLAFVILAFTCSEMTLILCYLHLRAQDYRWWWRSFFTSGFGAVYMFVYCCHYFIVKLSIEDTVSTFLYFGYTIIMVFLFFIMTGSIGFFVCLWFTRKIYSV